jgi:hypothetical protein
MNLKHQKLSSFDACFRKPYKFPTTIQRRQIIMSGTPIRYAEMNKSTIEC